MSKCIKFFTDIGYRFADEFTINFDEEGKDTAQCTVLEPGNRQASNLPLPWTILHPFGEEISQNNGIEVKTAKGFQEYVLAPEIFISEGSPGSIVHEWASKRNGGGLHHIALQVGSDTTVRQEMDKWLKNGWIEGFSTPEPIVCKELVQSFSKPSSILGVVFELIERKEAGFCRSSVRDLMLSTKEDHR